MTSHTNSNAPAQRSGTARGVLGGGAWRLGEISGIEIAVDYSWVLIFALITFSLAGSFAQELAGVSRPLAWTAAVATSLLFFASIVLHELGHSLVAQRLGLRVRSITLFIFGGVAQLESEPRRPGHEILIAIAGPLVSFVLAVAFGTLEAVFQSDAGEGETLATMMGSLARINWLLAIFNCVPGFPLDGGRVLRGLVWAMTGSFDRATRIAAAAGSFVAYGLIGLGIVVGLGTGQLASGLWLAFIGWFLLSAARASVGQLAVERALSGLLARDAAESVRGACISGGDGVAEVTQRLLHSGLRTFYVVDADGRLCGLVTIRELASVADADRPHTRIDQVMVPTSRLLVVGPEDPALVALRRMAESGVNQLPLVSDGRLLGAVTRERLINLVQAGVALRSARGN